MAQIEDPKNDHPEDKKNKDSYRAIIDPTEPVDEINHIEGYENARYRDIDLEKNVEAQKSAEKEAEISAEEDVSIEEELERERGEKKRELTKSEALRQKKKIKSLAKEKLKQAKSITKEQKRQAKRHRDGLLKEMSYPKRLAEKIKRKALDQLQKYKLHAKSVAKRSPKLDLAGKFDDVERTKNEGRKPAVEHTMTLKDSKLSMDSFNVSESPFVKEDQIKKDLGKMSPPSTPSKGAIKPDGIIK